jgi:hypothetical protein
VAILENVIFDRFIFQCCGLLLVFIIGLSRNDV